MLDKINDYDREYYVNKKEKFANEKADNTGKIDIHHIEKWGDFYGYKLFEVYSEEEVVEFEKYYDVILPETLRKYLINVSRELFIDSTPYVMDLDLDMEFFYLDKNGSDKNMPIELHNPYYNSINYYSDEDLYKYLLELEAVAKPLGYSLNYCLCIGNNEDIQTGKCNQIYLCIKGPFCGQYINCEVGGFTNLAIVDRVYNC
jgi:hypothetical protein